MRTSSRPAWRLLVVSLTAFLATHVTHGEEASLGSERIDEEAYRFAVQFYDYDPTIPLEARVVERKETDTGDREKVIFRGTRGALVPGYLELPKKGDSPFPCVLLLHGWSGSKEHWWRDGGYISGGDVRKALLDAGYAVLALDAPTHGDRIAENDYAMVNNYTGPGSDERKNYFTVPEIVVQCTVDYRRGLDYLQTRERIDMTRIGLLGYSMGGVQSVLLTAVDPRIQVAVGCVVPSWTKQFNRIAAVHYVRGIGERPYLMLMGRDDPLCSVEDAQQIHDLIPGTEKDIIFYESGHSLPAAYVDDAVRWFQAHL